MNTALIGGTSEASSRWRPTSMMLSVRVPSGTRSGRASRPGVFGNAKDAPLTSPPPGTPNFPASAGSAKIARMPLPPFWFRSSPLPTLIAAGESVWYHSANARGVRNAPATGERHELVDTLHVAPDERAVDPATTLELGGDRPGQHHVRPRPECQMEVGAPRDHGASRVDDDEPRARLPRAVDPGHEVEVRPGDVVAPDDDEPGVGDLLGPDAG